MIWAKDSIKNLKILIRDGDILKLRNGKILKDGTITVDDRAYIVQDLRPYILDLKYSKYPCLIVDAKTFVVYRFNEKEIEQIPLDPLLAKKWLKSTILQKLTAVKPDNLLLLMAFFMGMFAFMLITQYLPKG